MYDNIKMHGLIRPKIKRVSELSCVLKFNQDGIDCKRHYNEINLNQSFL